MEAPENLPQLDMNLRDRETTIAKQQESTLRHEPLGVVIRTLAELPKETLIDEAALANALQISTRTVRRMVGRYELPPPVRFAGRATWQSGRILAWYTAMAEAKEKKAKVAAERFRSLT